MIIDPVAATVAGVLAAQCMEVPGYVQRALGMRVLQDVFAENGAIVRAPVRYRRVVGWLVHPASTTAWWVPSSVSVPCKTSPSASTTGMSFCFRPRDQQHRRRMA